MPRPTLRSTLSCPSCGGRIEEPMPQDRCVVRYLCPHCGWLMRPKAGDCCVFCSYGTVRCPPEQGCRP